ncbi:cell filamentation protein Fic [Candidatus Woesearchaeota archaeon]|nr:cell filamentation protein Fic [Candidatus Woesearchaeota archaeon]|tara:strand:- start:8288 stop:9187 length:900 start_codon:yes stop_codon:yes gene_type:complete
MYIEKRKNGKYYLVHSYREDGKVRKIRKYLGLNPPKEETKRKAKEAISNIIREQSTEVFFFSLTKAQLEKLNRYNDKIKIAHLNAKEWQRFTEDFVYNTNAIEGSTVRREEVPGILKKEKGLNKDETETKGVAKAVEFIRGTKEELSLKLVLKLHKLCFESSKHFAGKLRDVEVVIRNPKGEVIHQGVPAKEVKPAVQDIVLWYKENKNKFRPLALAAIVHNQFEHVHPFQDGNGRIGRLLLNYVLIKKRYPPINITLEDRTEYYKALREYDKLHDIKPMLRLLISQFKKTLKKVTTES